MRPISTFNTMNVVGQVFAPAASLNQATIHSTLRTMANPPSLQDESSGKTGDSVNLSNEGRALAKGEEKQSPAGVLKEIAEEVENDPAVKQARTDGEVVKVGAAVSTGLNEAAEEERTRDLEERDEKVRRRAEAQKAAAGSLAGGSPVYQYEIGPDGRQYAVSGHVNIKVREGRTPEERLKNAEKAERAATAGGEITPKSAQIAAEARREARRAREEIEEQKREDGNESEQAPAPLSSRSDTSTPDVLKPNEDNEPAGPGGALQRRVAETYEEMQNSRTRPLD
ncbi:hypothetical protein GF324_09180 [bacterium]|nr:hypothetical protein [bacterium]